MVKYVLEMVSTGVYRHCNNMLRENGYERSMSESHAYQLLTLTGALLSGMYISDVCRSNMLASTGQGEEPYLRRIR